MTQAETMASVAVTIPKITVENGKKKNNDLTIKNPHHKPPALCDTALRAHLCMPEAPTAETPMPNL